MPREAIAVNIGGPGTINVGTESFPIGTRDMLYLGLSNSDVAFASSDPGRREFIVSAPAHTAYPNRLLTIAGAKRLGSGCTPATRNQRSIFQYIYPEAAVKTCQLIAGITTFAPGSVWNTMPAHVHDRRMEAYLYFDLPETARVFHMMGEPQETLTLSSPTSRRSSRPLGPSTPASAPQVTLLCGPWQVTTSTIPISTPWRLEH